MRRDRDSFAHPQPPLAPAPNRQARVLAPEQAARLAIARRAKASALPNHVRLVFTLKLRRELAEQLAARGIRVGKNIEGVIMDLLEQGAAVWR